MVATRDEYVEVELPSGGTILAKVTTTGVTDVGAREKFHLDETRAAIGEIARWAIDSVTDNLPRKPDKVGVEFGIKLTVKSGKLISALTEAGGEASLLVKLEWSTSQTAAD